MLSMQSVVSLFSTFIETFVRLNQPSFLLFFAYVHGGKITLLCEIVPLYRWQPVLFFCFTSLGLDVVAGILDSSVTKDSGASAL